MNARDTTNKPEELVPSRYALQVGDIEVLVISDGVLPLPTQTMSTNADPADKRTDRIGGEVGGGKARGHVLFPLAVAGAGGAGKRSATVRRDLAGGPDQG